MYGWNYPNQLKSGLNGRIIASIDEIGAQDVSMQGISVFPMADMSAVIVKMWNGNGLIDTYIYKMSNEKPKDFNQMILERIEKVEKRLDDGLQSASNAIITEPGTNQQDGGQPVKVSE